MEDCLDRWLLLEQVSDRSDWSVANCEHLIFDASGIRPGNGAPSGSPAEREICILFLPERTSGLQLPDAYTNRSTRRWNVWCHYGRDISLADCPQRWQSYERLSDLDKAGLTLGGTQPPLPFSRGMPQPWSEEFEALKREVAQQQRPTDNTTNSFQRCLDLLQRAWALATGVQGTQALLEQGREALSAVLAARFLLNSLPSHLGADAQTRQATLIQVLSQCHESGLLAMAPRKEHFSPRMRQAYRRVGFTVLYLKCLTKPAAQHQLRAADLEQLRRALRTLLTTADAEAAIITKALMRHP